jgi:hypothetical protein
MVELLIKTNKILIGQKRALRAMLNLKPDESVKQHFTDQNILTVYSMYILESVMFVRKNQSNYVTHEDFHFYNTRHKKNIVLPIHNNEFFYEETIICWRKIYEVHPFRNTEYKKLQKIYKSLYTVSDKYPRRSRPAYSANFQLCYNVIC